MTEIPKDLANKVLDCHIIIRNIFEHLKEQYSEMEIWSAIAGFTIDKAKSMDIPKEGLKDLIDKHYMRKK